MRIIVCGSRGFADAKLLAHVLDNIWQEAGFPPLTIVHGAARGADRLAADWADSNLSKHGGGGAEQEAWPADWEGLGRRAGIVRNQLMAIQGADLCVAFWDGRSPGTRNMIETAKKHGIPVRVVSPPG